MSFYLLILDSSCVEDELIFGEGRTPILFRAAWLPFDNTIFEYYCITVLYRVVGVL